MLKQFNNRLNLRLQIALEIARNVLKATTCKFQLGEVILT